MGYVFGHLSNSYNSMLPNSSIVRLDSSMNVLDIHFISKSLMMDLVRYPPCSLSTNVCILVIRSSSLKMTSCDTPWTQRSTWNESSSLTTLLSLLLPAASLTPVVITLVPLPLLFLDASQITLLLLLIPGTFETYSWSWPWCGESLILSRLTFLSYYSFDTTRRHCLVSNDGMRFCLPKCKTFFLCRGQMNPIHGVLSAFPLGLVVYLSRFRHVTLEIFFNLVSSGVQGVKKTVFRPSRLSFPLAIGPRSQDWQQVEHLRWNKNCFQLKSMATWPINSGSTKSRAACPWIARIHNKVLQEFWQFWNRVLLLPFQIWLIHSLSVKVSLRCLMKVNFSFWRINPQWISPSASLSRQCSWRTNFPTIFEIWCPKSYLCLNSFAVMSSHFLSRIGMWPSDELTALTSWLNSGSFCMNFLLLSIISFFKASWRLNIMDPDVKGICISIPCLSRWQSLDTKNWSDLCMFLYCKLDHRISMGTRWFILSA